MEMDYSEGEYFGVGVAQLDGDVADELVFVSDGVHAADRLHERCLPVRHVADPPHVDCRLQFDHLRRQRCQGLDVLQTNKT